MNVLKDAGIIEKSAQFPGNFTLSIAKVHPD